ncbi:LamG-like jellyroll fold domain-containing protein [Verrucomicrobiota bacterium]
MNKKTSTEWKLATDDTTVTVSVDGNRISMVSLKNPGRDWEWVPTPSEIPLPGRDSVRVGSAAYTPDWTYSDATEDRSNGYTVVLRFTSTKPALELKSFWRAQAGPGPVENWVTIENRSDVNVNYTPGIVAGRLQARSDKQVSLHRADKTAVGVGKVYVDPIGANVKFSTGTGVIPFIMLDAGSDHGLYMGFEWELGGFVVESGVDPLSIAASAHPLTENVSREPGKVFNVPSVYYGAYRGDIDDGANKFKRWFWNHKITRSLHDNADEPWVEVCMQDLGGKGSSSITGLTPQSAYERLAATGAECVKMDFWDGTGQCWYNNRDWTFKPAVWPNGFDFAAKAHKAGLKASLYMGGTYNDCDLTTIAGRDAELAAVLERFDKGWFDMWRTDRYTAPCDPMPSTYQGVANFMYIQDHLIANRPGYRYENCCNGGKFKGFAVCRRMTFCTMNDKDQDPVLTRTTYYANTFAINPVQLKSDLGPAQTAYQLRTDMLGSILTWAVDNPVYRQHIALYKSRQRPILRGANVYHILPMPDGRNWDGLQFHNPDLDRGSVFLFKPSPEAPTSQVVRLRGLMREKAYDVVFQDAAERSCSMTGARLMDEGISVTLTGKDASEIIWLNCPQLCSVPDSLMFVAEDQGKRPAVQQVVITYRRGPEPGKAFTFTAADPWLRVTQVSGAGDGQTVAVSVEPGDMPSGMYRSSITLSRQGLSDRLIVPVKFRNGSTLAWWKLDERDGNTAGDSWGRNPGSLVGGPTWGAGKHGGALHFNGKGQYVDTGWSLDGLQLPCTFAFWVNPAAAQVTYADIFGNHRGSEAGVVMQQDGDKTNLYSFGYGSSPAPGGAGPVRLVAGEWQHVAVVCDGASVVIHRNGVEVARGTGVNPLTPNPSLGFRLGSGYSVGRFFNGALDDFRIYARALTGTEVATLAQKPGKAEQK